MELSGIKKILSAAESAGIKTWIAVTDIPTHLYNNDQQINVIDEDQEILFNIAPPQRTTGEPFAQDQIVVRSASLADVHEVKLAGDLPNIKSFLTAYGITLSAEDELKLVKINSGNFRVKPVGNYDKFVELSPTEEAALSPQRKAEYEKNKAEYERNKKMQRNIMVTIS